MNIASAYAMLESVNKMMEKLLENTVEVDAETVGLDPCCGKIILIEDDCVIVKNGYLKYNLEYYGGFEYIDDDTKMVIGDYTIYTNESSKVRDVLERYEDSQ